MKRKVWSTAWIWMASLVLVTAGTALARDREETEAPADSADGGGKARWIKMDAAKPTLNEKWMPYFLKKTSVMLIDEKMTHDEKVNKYYLHGTRINEDFWWLINYSDYQGPKQRFGIVDFSVDPALEAMITRHGFRSGVAIAGLEATLMSEFAKTKRFVLVERGEKALSDVLGEQNFGDSGRVWKKSAPKIGRILGAQFLIDATVNEYAPDASKWGVGGGGVGAGKKGFFGGLLGVGKSNSLVTITFKIIDAESSVVIATVKRTGRIAKFGLAGGGGGVGKDGAGALGASRQEKARMQLAIQNCMAMAVYEMVHIPAILKSRMQTHVVKTVKQKDGKTLVIVAAGSNMGLKEGMQFNVMKKMEVVNKETGEDLGDDIAALLGEVGGTDVNKGTLVLTKVQEKVALGSLLQGGGDVKEGDLVMYREGK